ncbi:phenylalanine--tRNA ligase subunit beta [Vagococcus bubulae]|uniref:Phenylalanine--tRNA ligase beta subunit n=1 Tax=Vagococcus bubulae TaxID=1977868 RepID=A0A429ZGN1_9ENTE|nr:phenylalanine--tRNA ligase subunit beta [Vagococcus bubulae]RST92835.1 phenylalanine--tRNA ligase subunit beta [Vagococcus bubulae]
MLVSYKWLQELVDVKDIDVNDLADKMSRSGIEVEDVTIPEEGLKKIVVGDVKECVPHPDSDHLSICQVDVGEDDLYQIVCGAPNITAGKKVIVALPNSRIAGNVKIKKGKMRGEVSLGMICSLQELGYSDSVVPKEYAEGIYFLPDDAVPGQPVFSYLDMDDAIIELSVTPNRADALSMIGVGYEVAAIYDKDIILPTVTINENPDEQVENYVSITLDNEEDVPSYGMKIIKDVTIKESPMWLQNRLMNEGIRPINNIVDVTNYTLLLFGQPQHAFDYDKLATKTISVRRAKDKESLTTLDGVERELTVEDLVITNGEKAIALAGVMGGEDTEITNETTTIALETAVFNPTRVRRTARRLALSSESSRRFERGINWSVIRQASEFSANLMAELGGGTIVTGEALVETKTPKEPTVSITLEKINRSLGTNLTAMDVEKIFLQLGFEVALSGETFDVTIPLRRWDISIPADLLEEVARIYGYDNLPSTLPSGFSLPGKLTFKQQMIRHIRSLLEGKGLTEAISYALTSPESAVQFKLESDNTEDIVELDFPMSEEHSVLRQSLVNGLLKDVSYNVARKASGVAFYEIGHVFNWYDKSDLPKETTHLAMAMTGLSRKKDWKESQEVVDFYTMKGVVESLMSFLGLDKKVVYQPNHSLKEMHPGRTADVFVGDTRVGFVGQVHPKLLKEMDLKETYVVELDLDQLFEFVPEDNEYKEVGKYPSIKRDIALLVDETVSHQQIVDVIEANGGKNLKSIHLFDLFTGEKLGKGKKSLAYSLVFQNDDQTLVEDEVVSVMNKIEKSLINELGIEVR